MKLSFRAILSSLIAIAIGKVQGTCTAAQRLARAEQIPYSYSISSLSASYTAFSEVPFASDCYVKIFADGLPGVQTAVDNRTTILFATATPQLFNEVTGEYTDIPGNGSTIIHTNVTFGITDIVPLPVTFYADVYLDYNLETCLIEAVRAFAVILSVVLGLILYPPALPSGCCGN